MTSAVSTQTRLHNLGPLQQIPLGEGRAFVVGAAEVAVFRTRSGNVHATQARCTHKDGPLADGMVGGQTLVCPLHAYKFNLATGDPVGHGCAALRTYPVCVNEREEIVLGLPAATDP